MIEKAHIVVPLLPRGDLCLDKAVQLFQVNQQVSGYIEIHHGVSLGQ
jgi:hypothetical protein